jgi:hypothetical protein
MGENFDVDKFCSDMQQKAKNLKGSAKEIKQDLNKANDLFKGVKTHVTITVNGKKVEHDYPCHVKDCDICKKVDIMMAEFDDMEKRFDTMFGPMDDFFDDGV